MSFNRTGEAENRGGDVSAGSRGQTQCLMWHCGVPGRRAGGWVRGETPGHGGQNSPMFDEKYKLRFQEAQRSPNQKLTAQ